MAKDAANDLKYFLLIEKEHQSYLGNVRHWTNLKVGFDEGEIWVKDLDYTQLHTAEIKTIPYKKLYTEKDGRLFPLDSLLPQGRIPSLMWTPIDRAFPVSLPSLNHNYFGAKEKLEMRLVPVENEREAVAMIISLERLGDYLQTAPAIRLKGHCWTLVDRKCALLTGTPLLPVEGEVYWKDGAFLLPAGFNLELHSVNGLLAQLLNVEQGDTILWNRDGSCIRIQQEDLQQLSLSSYRLTMQNEAIS